MLVYAGVDCKSMKTTWYRRSLLQQEHQCTSVSQMHSIMLLLKNYLQQVKTGHRNNKTGEQHAGQAASKGLRDEIQFLNLQVLTRMQRQEQSCYCNQNRTICW